MSQPTFPGAESVTAPGIETALTPVAPADNESFMPTLDVATFDGLFGTTTHPSAAMPIGQGGPQATGKRAEMVKFAESMLGTPYSWGGTSARGVDCSGLTYLAGQSAGVSLPRVSFEQANIGKRLALSDLQPGDLVAWDLNARNNGADHIAIYVGDGQIIEAPRPGVAVRRRKLGADEGAWGVRVL